MALYHKHRPQTFESVVGQEHIITTIKNQIANAKTAHAYLFSGPRGVGKTTTARLLAKAMNCTGRKQGMAEPCNTCTSCEEITRSRAIDVIEIDAASHTGVDNVRENIIDNAQFKPTISPYKIFIIDEVHMLSTSAFNALLKTLEEPPPHVLFILATTEKHKLPETIISRCQRFDFKKVGYEIMKQHLEQVAQTEHVRVEKEVLDRLINKSDGCVRDAVSLLDQLMATGEEYITRDVASVLLPTSRGDDTLPFIDSLLSRNAKAGLEHIQQLVGDGANLGQFAYDVIELLRILLVTTANPDMRGLGLDLSEATKKELRSLGAKISSLELVQLIDLLLRRRAEIKSAPLPQLPLELAVIEWCEGGANDGGETPKSDHSAIARPEQNAAKSVSPTLHSEDKPTIVDRVRHFVHKDKTPAITSEQVQACWQTCVQSLEQDSPSLAFILGVAAIHAVEDHTITLAVEYALHYDKLIKNKEAKKKIETILSRELKTTIELNVIVASKQDEGTTESDELQRLTATFGGEVVT